MKPDPFILQPLSVGYGGLSIGRWQGKVVMIKGVIPGETVEAAIEEEKRDYIIASVSRIVEPSPDRIMPDCRYFGICGGCHLQYISYSRQIKLKEEILSDCIKRLANIDMQLSDSMFHDLPWRYRYRGQFKVSDGRIGFYREKTRDVVDIENCPLMIDEINVCLKNIRNMLDSGHKDFFEYISDIHISYSDRPVVLLKVKDVEALDLKRLASVFLDLSSGVAIDNGKRVSLYGLQYITLSLQGLKYTISPLSFFQSHWSLNQDVVSLVKNILEPLNNKRVLDLYSGAGNFSLPIAQSAKEVIGIEENPFAVKDGKRNANLNLIENCRFILSTAEKVEINNFDIIIVDPPRTGLTNRAIERILSSEAERIVYISCNPSTLARDIRKFTLKYDIDSIRMIDFFPQTYHIESLAFLKLR